LPNSDNSTLLNIYLSCPESGRREFVPHHHTELELAYFLSGSGTYSVLNKSYPIKKGDIFLFGNDEIHKITEVLPGEPMQILNIHFAPRLLWENDDQVSSSQYRKVFWGRNENFAHQLDRNNVVFQEIQSEIIQIENEWKNQSVCFELMIRFSIIKILILISRNFNFINEKEDSFNLSTGNFTAINNTIQYIDHHFTEEISIAQLSSSCNMTQNGYSIYFKRMNGITPCNYIISKRINRAVHLLKNSDMGIFEIALESGYHNTANFNKAFRKLIGMTPSDYKKILQAKKPDLLTIEDTKCENGVND